MPSVVPVSVVTPAFKEGLMLRIRGMRFLASHASPHAGQLRFYKLEEGDVRATPIAWVRVLSLPRMTEFQCQCSVRIMNDDPVAILLFEVAAQNRTAFRDLYSATSAKLFGVLLRILGDRKSVV